MSKPTESVSKDYIFSENAKGELTFRGNFEDYYKDVQDPWGQSAKSDPDMDSYYHKSRQQINNWIKNIQPKSALEVGCGLGYALEEISEGSSAEWWGTDISPTAIEKAKSLFPEFNFFAADISAKQLKLQRPLFECIVLNQLLWYILPSLDIVVSNIGNHLPSGGTLIVSNAFARNQRFGREYIDGFAGAVQYFEKCSETFLLKRAEFSDDGYRVNDGIFLLEKK